MSRACEKKDNSNMLTQIFFFFFSISGNFGRELHGKNHPEGLMRGCTRVAHSRGWGRREVSDQLTGVGWVAEEPPSHCCKAPCTPLCCMSLQRIRKTGLPWRLPYHSSCVTTSAVLWNTRGTTAAATISSLHQRGVGRQQSLWSWQGAGKDLPPRTPDMCAKRVLM